MEEHIRQTDGSGITVGTLKLFLLHSNDGHFGFGKYM